MTSHTADPADLTAYGRCPTTQGRRFVLRWRGEGVAEVAELVDGAAVKVADRDRGGEADQHAAVRRSRRSCREPEEDEFYLADLIGLAAVDADGAALGTVATVHDYGAGASLEIVRDGAAAAGAVHARVRAGGGCRRHGRVLVALPEEVSTTDVDGRSWPASTSPVAPARRGSGQPEP